MKQPIKSKNDDGNIHNVNNINIQIIFHKYRKIVFERAD